MTPRRQIRRVAMQVMYQLDLRGEGDRAAVLEGLPEGPDLADVYEPGFALAEKAWAAHEAADALVRELAPQWPTHRQPPVDRAILRLAYYEMISGHAPVKVAINEAIELAKAFGAEQSPSFINGVLDKVAKRIPAPGETSASAEASLPAAETVQPSDATDVLASTGDAWLDDALDADDPSAGGSAAAKA